MTNENELSAQKQLAQKQLWASRRRIRFGVVMILAILVLLTGRLFQIQILDGASQAQAATNKRLVSTQDQPLRGSIVDDKGNVLAQSVERYDLVISPQDFQKATKDDGGIPRKDPATGKITEVPVPQGISELAQLLGQDAADLTTKIMGQGQYALLAKQVSPDIKDKVLALGFPALEPQMVQVRNYPNGAVAGQLLGFEYSGGKTGLENSQDKYLSGTAGTRTFEVGGDGIRIPYATNKDTPAVNGSTVTLTLDKDLQFSTQQYVSSLNQKFGGEWACAVVLDKNSNIVAMADSSYMDPNDPAATPADDRQSKCVSASIEPGSTTKLVTMAGALEEGLVEPTSVFTTGYEYTIDGQTFHDSVEHPTEQRTAAGILANSYNTGTVQIGSKMSKQERYDWLTKFGANKMLNIGVDGSTAGFLAKPQDWDDRQQYTVLFGQGIAQSVLHTAMQYQAIANGGVIKAPRLVASYTGPDGKQVAAPEDPGTRIVSPDTVSKLDGMLETVTVSGYGKSGALDQWRVGSKTGTAESPSPQGGYSGITVSYAGIAPMDNPQYVVVVTVQHPKIAELASSPGPAFQQIMKQVLIQNKVPPSTSKPNIYPVLKQ